MVPAASGGGQLLLVLLPGVVDLACIGQTMGSGEEQLCGKQRRLFW
jgi:hypothetical protein